MPVAAYSILCCGPRNMRIGRLRILNKFSTGYSVDKAGLHYHTPFPKILYLYQSIFSRSPPLVLFGNIDVSLPPPETPLTKAPFSSGARRGSRYNPHT